MALPFSEHGNHHNENRDRDPLTIQMEELSAETKIKTFNSVYVPILTYGCETPKHGQ
jgi:hypothetical protein